MFEINEENVKNGKSLEDIQKDARIKKTIRKPKAIKPNEVEKKETTSTTKINLLTFIVLFFLFICINSLYNYYSLVTTLMLPF